MVFLCKNVFIIIRVYMNFALFRRSITLFLPQYYAKMGIVANFCGTILLYRSNFSYFHVLWEQSLHDGQKQEEPFCD